MIWTSNSTWKFIKSPQVTGREQNSRIGSVHKDMIRRNINLTLIDRSEGCYVFRFICIQHACCSGAITSKWARPVTRPASPKSCTPCLCHEFLEWRSCRCIYIRDVQMYKGHRIVTASLKKLIFSGDTQKPQSWMKMWSLTSGTRWIAHQVGPSFGLDRVVKRHSATHKDEQTPICTNMH